MKTKLYLAILIRVIALFSIGMFMAFINPYLHNFLGDVYIGVNDNSEVIRDGYKWGAVHYWFFWMCFFVFILSLINFVVSVDRLITTHSL